MALGAGGPGGDAGGRRCGGGSRRTAATATGRAGLAGRRPPGDNLDRLLETALRLGGTAVPAGSAVRLRGDQIAGRAVDVVEVPADRAALRYWIDRDGVLRRLELPAGGVWAQLDLTPGRVPALPVAA